MTFRTVQQQAIDRITGGHVMSELTPEKRAELRNVCNNRHIPLSGTAAFLKGWSPDVCLALLDAADEQDRLEAENARLRADIAKYKKRHIERFRSLREGEEGTS